MIYFARGEPDGPIKVGFCRDGRVGRRLTEIRQAVPWELRLLGTMQGGRPHEVKIHHSLSDFRVRGEWFEAHPDVLSAIRKLLDPTFRWPSGRLPRICRARVPAAVKPALSSADEVIDKLGGTSAAARLIDGTDQQVCNWRRAKKIPAPYYLITSRELDRLGFSAAPEIWGMH